MNAALVLLLDGDLASQARGETLHLAFLAFAGGAALVSGAVSWLLRRDLKRRDDDQATVQGDIKRVGDKVDANDRRHGYEIADIKIAVAPLFTKAGLDQPDYPSR